jgi:hypothetical protein
MKTLISFLSILLFCGIASAQVNPNSTYVNGHYRSNGTYVNGYYKTTPNNTINDNYSTYPNYNPYTGQQGTRQPTYSYPSNSNSNNYNNNGYNSYNGNNVRQSRTAWGDPIFAPR